MSIEAVRESGPRLGANVIFEFNDNEDDDGQLVVAASLDVTCNGTN